MKEEKFYEEVPGNPAITRMAAQLQREGPIGDRLYNSAVEQQQRHRERVERAELEKIERAKAAAAFHSNTQRDLRNLASRGEEEVEEILIIKTMVEIQHHKVIVYIIVHNKY